MDDDLTQRLQSWVDGYVRAWNSNDPAAIGALFSQDAAYCTEPYRAPWRGRDEIVRQWLDRKDEPRETEFRWHPVAIGPDVAVVQGETMYHTPPRTYSNLWVIRLDAEGRCTEFTEWWMRHPDSDSSTPQSAEAP